MPNEQAAKVVVFSLDTEEYAIPVSDVKEVIKIVEISPIPNSPEFVEGFINLRGSVVPVLNIEKRFELNRQTDYQGDRKIIVIDAQGNPFGIIVDDVMEVITLPEGAVREAPDVVSQKVGSDYLHGIILIDDTIKEENKMSIVDSAQQRSLLYLDLNKVMTKEESTQLQNLKKGSDGQPTTDTTTAN